jgi:hypothetical protein
MQSFAPSWEVTTFGPQPPLRRRFRVLSGEKGNRISGAYKRRHRQFQRTNWVRPYWS